MYVCVYVCMYVYIYIYINNMYMYIYIYIYIYIHTHTHYKRPSLLSPYMSLQICNSTHDLRMAYVSKHDCAYETTSCEPEQSYVLKPRLLVR